MNDILKYNRINSENATVPNYNLDEKEINIEIFFNIEKELIIVGRIDNNYICWLSSTSIDDEEVNSKIFDYLASERPETISNLYTVLGDKYDNIDSYFKARLTRTDIPGEWRTPFGYYFGAENKEEHGRFFAGSIISYFDRLQEKAKVRSCDGKYIEILKRYYSTMTKSQDPLYYCRVQTIIDIIKDESFLLLAKDEKLRKVYIDCCKESRGLYNTYMSAVR